MESIMRSLSTVMDFKTIYFSWTIPSFGQLVKFWPGRFESDKFDVYSNCCSLKLMIYFYFDSKLEGEETIKYTTFIISSEKESKLQVDVDSHIKSLHGFYGKSAIMYLIDSDGQKRMLDTDMPLEGFEYRISVRSDVFYDELKTLLCNGALEFRAEYTLRKISNRSYDMLGPLQPLEDHGVNFKNLLETGTLSDFTIQTKDDPIKVHKAVLAARSSVFATMLSVDMKEKIEDSLDLSFLDTDTVRRFVQYIYTDKLAPGEDGDREDGLCLELLKLADQYQIPRLKALCEIYLIRSLSVGNVVEAMKVADTYGAENLLCSALEFFNMNKSIIKNDDTYLELISHSSRLKTSILDSLSNMKL